MREYLKKRIKGLYKECVSLKKTLDSLEQELKEAQGQFTQSDDMEKLVSLGVFFKRNTLKAIEGERQFSRYVSSLEELLLLQETYCKEDVDEKIKDFVKQNKYQDMFAVNNGALIYVDKESEKIIEESFLDVEKIKHQIKDLKK